MKPLFLAVALCGSAVASAQTSAPATGSGGGLAGLLGGALPNMASTGAGNAAGLLGYCIKNNVVSGANASSVLGQLTGKQGVAGSEGFLAGQQGKVQTGNGQAFSLASVKGRVKTQLCNQVLKRARSFI